MMGMKPWPGRPAALDAAAEEHGDALLPDSRTGPSLIRETKRECVWRTSGISIYVIKILSDIRSGASTVPGSLCG